MWKVASVAAGLLLWFLPVAASAAPDGMVPLRIPPAMLDARDTRYLATHDVSFFPYRVAPGPIVEVDLTGPRGSGLNTLFVHAGATLRLCGRGALDHAPMTFAPGLGAISSGSLMLAPGRCFDVRLTRPGTFELFCKIHAHEFLRIAVAPSMLELTDASAQLLMLHSRDISRFGNAPERAASSVDLGATKSEPQGSPDDRGACRSLNAQGQQTNCFTGTSQYCDHVKNISPQNSVTFRSCTVYDCCKLYFPNG